MKKILIVIFMAITVAFYSCNDDTDKVNNPTGDETVILDYDFNSNDEGWNTGLADFPAADEDLYNFEVDLTTSPADDEEDVLVLSASNPNDDNLFMFASKHITGLDANTMYDVSYTLDIVPNVVVDTTGLGADTTGFVANDTVTIKAGAVSEEPETEEDDLDFLQLINIDIGDPGVDGTDLMVIGSFPADTTNVGFVQQTVSTDDPISARTNEDGDLWLIVGAESYGSKTEIYINKISVEIKR